MKRSIAVIGLGLALACPGVQTAPQATVGADRPEPRREDLSDKVPAGMPVHVDNPYGNVYLRFGGYEHAVDIHSTLQQPVGAPAIALHRGRENGRYVIAPRLAEGTVLEPAQRIDLVVYVAQGHAVTVRTGSGDIESRGVKSALDLRSTSGNIAVRGNDGTVQAETGTGNIEVTFPRPAPAGSRQRLATTTGTITVGVTDQLDAKVTMATSAAFATDYSIDVTHDDGKEPDKWAQTVIGTPNAEIALESRQGEIRMLRRAVFVEVGERPPR